MNPKIINILFKRKLKNAVKLNRKKMKTKNGRVSALNKYCSIITTVFRKKLAAVNQHDNKTAISEPINRVNTKYKSYKFRIWCHTVKCEYVIPIEYYHVTYSVLNTKIAQ